MRGAAVDGSRAQRASFAVKRGLLAAGVYRRRLRRRPFPGVAVLCYHGVRGDDVAPGGLAFEELHVPESRFAAHADALRRLCEPISLDRWRAALAGGPPLPPRAVLVTFDDGYRSVATRALPILERYEIPAAVFVCDEPVTTRNLFWFDAVAARDGVAEVERRKREGADARVPVSDDDPRAALKADDVARLAAHPLVEVGGHTRTHRVLAGGDAARQREEIGANKAALEEWTGRRVRAFAYPNGRPGVDYGPESVALLSDLGFDAAFTTRPAFATADEPPLERSRFVVLAAVPAEELAHRLAWAWPR